MSDVTKQVIGLVGETLASLELHRRGWLVYRPVVDEQIDLIISRYYCKNCSDFSGLYTREAPREGKMRKTVTNLCEKCQEDDLFFIVRYLQVKTSAGVDHKIPGAKDFSYHPKLRYHVDPRSFYIWVAMPEDEAFYYIFHHSEVAEFDNLQLASYQVTDNQQIHLIIDEKTGHVLKNQRYINFFNDPNKAFYNFEKFEEIFNDTNFSEIA